MINLALPMDLMTSGHHHSSPQQQHPTLSHHTLQHRPQPTRLYNSPPPISNADPTVNDCKLIEYRGKNLVSFTVNGEKMLCLPQAVDIFLKDYVGGPHTVYCKLKRLDIVPLVCNTEQIRILRGLGVLQPGVNRCKLLSCKDFDILLDDCENASKPLRLSSSRPGRPPKRGSIGLSEYLTSTSSSSSIPQSPQLKKHRFNDEHDDTDNFLPNGHHLMTAAATASSNNDIPAHPYMQLNSFPNAGLHAQRRCLPTDDDNNFMSATIKESARNDMEAFIRSATLWNSNNHNANYQHQYEDMVKHIERIRSEQRLVAATDESMNLFGHKQHQKTSPSLEQLSPILNLSKPNRSSIKEIDCQSICSDHSEKVDFKSKKSLDSPVANLVAASASTDAIANQKNDNNNVEILNSHASSLNSPRLLLTTTSPIQSPLIGDDDEPSAPKFSMEILLRNIQALLKIATDNAMQHEKQIIYEKAELKMNVLREKEYKDSIEKQLLEERKLRVLYQKRYKKERKLRTRLG